jgi:hypothetical protein
VLDEHPMSIMDGRNCYAKNALLHPLSTGVEQFLVLQWCRYIVRNCTFMLEASLKKQAVG